MQKYNHIKASFFLGIFSLILLHQFVPHSHHPYKVEHSHKVVAHNNGHAHDHHHDIPKKDNFKKGLLDLFLDTHVHSVACNEMLIMHQSIGKPISVKKDVIKLLPFYHYSISMNYNDIEKVPVYHPPNAYLNNYLTSLDLRGPPTLG